MGPPDGYDNTKDDAREITRASTYGLAQRSSALVRRGLHDLSASDIGTFVELGKALTSTLQLDFSLTTLTLLFAIEVCFRRLRASDRHTPISSHRPRTQPEALSSKFTVRLRRRRCAYWPPKSY